MNPFRSLSLGLPLGLCLFSVASTVPAVAQIYNAPPAGIPGRNYGAAPQPGGPAESVRIDRLESRVRELTGQIEQLQFQMRRMEQQLQKFQQDVDYRLQENGGGRTAKPQPQRRGAIEPQQPEEEPREGDGEPPLTPRQQAGIEPRVIDAVPPGGGNRGGGGRTRGDAFAPQQDPQAPGAPRPLAGARGPYVPTAPRALPRGAIEPNAPDEPEEADPNAPLDLTGRGGRPAARMAPPEPDPNAGVLPGVPGQRIAPAQPRDRYRVALAAIKEQRYDEAELELQTFLKENPRSRLAADATFNLGMTYERRGRHREAAEQYLKITQQYEKSNRASESMLRLGLALERLGAREQACATWQEAGRKYPLAPGGVRVSLERQLKRAKC